jgi:gamma-glutamyl hydrolase
VGRPILREYISPEQGANDIIENQQLNIRPLIGIVTQPYNKTHDYIMSAYVKFVELSGARVVPIDWRQSKAELESLIPKLNGILFPGGDTYIVNEDGSLPEYSIKGKIILDKVKALNDQGIYYPIWAVCMGLEEIAVIEAPFPDTLLIGYFEAQNTANNVTLVSDLSKSKMFKSMPQHLINAIQKENITFNSHHDGMTPETFAKYDGLKEYQMIGVAYDSKGVEYVAIVEHKKYPIYGHQYHPEKNSFIFNPNLVIPHTLNAVYLAQYYSNFFVKE